MRNYFKKAFEIPWRERLVGNSFVVSLKNYAQKIFKIPWRERPVVNSFVVSLKNYAKKIFKIPWRERLVVNSFVVSLKNYAKKIFKIPWRERLADNKFVMSLMNYFKAEFKAPKRERLTEKSFMLLMFSSVFGIVMCAMCLTGLTLAFFSTSVTVSSGSIKASNFSISSIIIVPKELEKTSGQGEASESDLDEAEVTANQNEPVKLVPIKAEKDDANGTFSATLNAEGTYVVTLDVDGTGSGYCIIKIGDKEVKTENFAGDFSFEIEASGGGQKEITFTPVWGTPANNEAPVVYNGEIEIELDDAVEKIDEVETDETEGDSADEATEHSEAEETEDSSDNESAEESDDAEETSTAEESESIDTAVNVTRNAEQNESVDTDGVSINRCITADSKNTKLQYLDEGEYKDLGGTPLIDGQINWQPGDWICKQLRIKNVGSLATKFSIGIDEETFAANYVLEPNLGGDSESYPYLGTHRSAADVVQIAVYPGTFDDLATEVKEKTGKDLSGREVIDEAVSAGILPLYSDVSDTEEDKEAENVANYYFAPIGDADSYQPRRYTGVLAPAGTAGDGISVISEDSNNQTKTYNNVTDTAEITLIAYWIPNTLSEVGVFDSDYNLENDRAASESTNAADLYDFNSHLPRQLKEKDASNGGLYVSFTLKVCAD